MALLLKHKLLLQCLQQNDWNVLQHQDLKACKAPTHLLWEETLVKLKKIIFIIFTKPKLNVQVCMTSKFHALCLLNRMHPCIDQKNISLWWFTDILLSNSTNRNKAPCKNRVHKLCRPWDVYDNNALIEAICCNVYELCKPRFR